MAIEGNIRIDRSNIAPSTPASSAAREIPGTAGRPEPSDNTGVKFRISNDEIKKIFRNRTEWQNFFTKTGEGQFELTDFEGFMKSKDISSEERLSTLLSFANKYPQQTVDAIEHFFAKIIDDDIATKESQAEYRVRDFKLDWYLELAKLYAAKKDYGASLSWITKIQEYKESKTSAKPKNYYESRFLLADTLAIRALQTKQMNTEEAKALMRKSVTVLLDNFRQLRSGQYGYLTSTSQILLGILAEYRNGFEESFPVLHYADKKDVLAIFGNDQSWKAFFDDNGDLPFLSMLVFKDNAEELIQNSDITPEQKQKLLAAFKANIVDYSYGTDQSITDVYKQMWKIAEPDFNLSPEALVENATTKYNSGYPYYVDNLVAVRSLLAASRYHLGAGELEEAERFSTEAENLIGQVENMSFAKRATSKVLGYLSIFSNGMNNPLNFEIFKALVSDMKSQVEMERHKRGDDTTNFYLKKASNYATRALTLAKAIRDRMNFEFYTGAGWQEKNTYNSILANYLDIKLQSGHRKPVEEELVEYFSHPLHSRLNQEESLWLYNKLFNIQNYLLATSNVSEVVQGKEDKRDVYSCIDGCFNQAYGSITVAWLINNDNKSWSLSCKNFLRAIAKIDSASDSDRPLLLARSYAWLGNLMKWAEEGKTDPAVEQQIIALAKPLAQTEEDKAVSETREGAIIVLYKAAIEQFQKITGKELYLEAEEASTRYQLADLAQGILEDPKIDASDPLRTAAQKITDKENYNNSIETAKAALAEIINKASAPENTHIKDNAIIDYASCVAQNINSLLSSAEAGSAYDEAKNQFEVLVESGEKLPASEELIKYCENSGCKYYYDDKNKTLVVRGKMTADEKTKLKEILTSETAKQAIEVLFNNSQNSLCVNMGKWTIPNTEGAIPPLLTIANALISKPFAENDNNGPITRIKVSEIADMAEAKIFGKYTDISTAPDHVKSQLADIAALRLYVLMGNTPAGEAIPNDKISSIIRTVDGAPIEPLTILAKDSKGIKEVSVSDVFMQQKLQLALASIWLRDKNTALYEKAAEWLNNIREANLNEAFRTNAGKMLDILHTQD